MPTSKCLRCGVADTVVPGSVCDTCLGDPGPTRPTCCPASPQPPVYAGVLPSGGYAVVGEVGRGGMGVVHRAVQVATDRTVAVKKLRPDAYTPSGLRRFAAEARMLARVDHPNVVKLIDFVPDAADPHLVMELVESVSLTRRVALEPLTADVAARMARDAARGVAAAHAAGVIHRDLKPGNLLVTADDRVKVADFGLGKRVDVDDGLTATRCSVGGTPGYLAPEQADPAVGPPGPPTDVWGLGACLYFALTGTAPFPTGMANVPRVLADPLIPPRAVNPAVPAALDAIVCKCLEKSPAARYATAAELADDLDRFRRGEPTVARPLPWRVKAWRRVRAVPRAVALAWAVAAVAVLAAGLVAAFTPRPISAAAEPADEHARLQELYLAGEELTLVPAKGLPAWSEWVAGRHTLGLSPLHDGSAYYCPVEHGVLKLFDPPTDSYRVSLDLLHESVVDWRVSSDAHVGLMLGHRRTDDGSGEGADSGLTVTFHDYDTVALRGGLPTRQPVVVESVHLYRSAATHKLGPCIYKLGGAVADFPADKLPPGKWRRIVAEVRPGGLTLFWQEKVDEPDGELVRVADYPAAELNEHFARHRDELRQNPHRPPMNLALIPDSWTPTGGIGIWSYGSGVAFRNVTVRRLP